MKENVILSAADLQFQLRNDFYKQMLLSSIKQHSIGRYGKFEFNGATGLNGKHEYN